MFFSIIVYHKILTIIPCVIQSDLVVCPFSVQQFTFGNPLFFFFFFFEELASLKKIISLEYS